MLPGRFCVSKLRRITSGQDGQLAMLDGRQRVVGGEAGFGRSQLCKVRRGIGLIRMLRVCIVCQDKAFRDRHGDSAKLVIRLRIVQANSVVDARVITRQIDTALLESSIDGNKAILVLAGRQRPCPCRPRRWYRRRQAAKCPPYRRHRNHKPSG